MRITRREAAEKILEMVERSLDEVLVRNSLLSRIEEVILEYEDERYPPHMKMKMELPYPWENS